MRRLTSVITLIAHTSWVMGQTETRFVLVALNVRIAVVFTMCVLQWQPDMGEVYDLKTQEGDVVVLGTDGLCVAVLYFCAKVIP